MCVTKINEHLQRHKKVALMTLNIFFSHLFHLFHVCLCKFLPHWFYIFSPFYGKNTPLIKIAYQTISNPYKRTQMCIISKIIVTYSSHTQGLIQEMLFHRDFSFTSIQPELLKKKKKIAKTQQRQIFSPSGTNCAVRSHVIQHLNRRQTPAFTRRPFCQSRPFLGWRRIVGQEVPTMPKRQTFSASCQRSLFFCLPLSNHTHTFYLLSINNYLLLLL